VETLAPFADFTLQEGSRVKNTNNMPNQKDQTYYSEVIAIMGGEAPYSWFTPIFAIEILTMNFKVLGFDPPQESPYSATLFPYSIFSKYLHETNQTKTWALVIKMLRKLK